jgi:uncharacterized protein
VGHRSFAIHRFFKTVVKCSQITVTFEGQGMTTPAGPLRPIQPNERIQILDVLRGFALFGVLLINMQDMAGFGPSGRHPGELDRFVSGAFDFLVTGRFKGLFSILFGIGFTIQIQRARARGVPFLARYWRRSLVLIGFGLLHFLFYPGDILTRYAVLGLLLLLFYRVPTRALVLVTVVLMGMRGVSGPVIRAMPGLNAALRAPAVHRTVEPCRELTTRYYGREAVYGAGSFRDVMVVNACRFPGEAIGWWIPTGRVAETLAYFLIGLLLGRPGVVRRFAQVLPRIRQVVVVGTVVGFSLLGIELLLPEGEGLWNMLPGVLKATGTLATTLAYGGAIILLFQRPFWQRWLAPLGAMGRMALTVYLGQTLVYSTMFYGYGLGWGIEAGHLALLALAVAIYLTEVFLCNAWLRLLRYGPFEWVWRGLTYLRFPQLRARPAA